MHKVTPLVAEPLEVPPPLLFLKLRLKRPCTGVASSVSHHLESQLPPSSLGSRGQALCTWKGRVPAPGTLWPITFLP